jgi:hypothetical protein
LLVQARRALNEERLTLPADDNAVGYAQRILELSPGHPQARRILEEAVARYGTMAKIALDRADAAKAQEVEKARAYHARAKRIAARYGLPDADPRRDAARLSAAAIEPQALEEKRAPSPDQAALIAAYAAKGSAALNAGNLAEAKRYLGLARDTAIDKLFPEAGLQELGQAIDRAERAALAERRPAPPRAGSGQSKDAPLASRPPTIFLPPAY